MRKIELVLISVLLFGKHIASSFLNNPKEVPSIFLATFFSIITMQIFDEGIRWQLAPIYADLCLQMLLAMYQSIFKRYALNEFQVQLLDAGLIAISSVLLILFPMFRTRRPDGPFKIANFITEWTDEKRPMWDLYAENSGEIGRKLLVRIWYPISDDIALDGSISEKAEYLPHSSVRIQHYARKINLPSFVANHFGLIKSHSVRSLTDNPLPISDSMEKYPVVLFSHGYGSSSDFNTVLAEQMASYGAIVLFMEHTFDAAVTYFPSSGKLLGFNASPPSDLKNEDEFWKFRRKHLDIRTSDMIFCLDTLLMLNHGKLNNQSKLVSLFDGRVNTQKIVAMGHSFGGATCINACNKDTRLKAAIGLDAWVTTLNPKIKNEGVDVPVLLLQAEKFLREEYFWSKNNMQECEKITEKSPQSKLIRIENAKHQDFLDLVIYAPFLSRLIGITGPRGYEIHEFLCKFVIDYLRELKFYSKDE